MRAFWRKFLGDLNTPLKKLVFVFLSLVIGIAGPFGSYITMSLFERTLYWGFIIGLSIVMITAIRSALILSRPQWSYWKIGTVASLILAITYSALIYYFTIHVFSLDQAMMPDLILLAGSIFLISIALHAIRYFTIETATKPENTAPRILQRLPQEKRGRVIRLSARDHFVDVFTENGMHSIRMRFADAVNETEDGTRGFCVHRSHWVAEDAIVDARKKNGRISVFLRDGSVVPVSRKYQHNVIENGFLKED